jgi:hypothetical protein
MVSAEAGLKTLQLLLWRKILADVARICARSIWVLRARRTVQAKKPGPGPGQGLHLRDYGQLPMT